MIKYDYLIKLCRIHFIIIECAIIYKKNCFLLYSLDFKKAKINRSSKKLKVSSGCRFNS